MKQYKFRPGFRGSRKISAQDVGLFLEKYFKYSVDPSALVSVARDKKCPIHSYFDWDDSVAASRWRVHQARGLINALYIEIENVGPVRAYENVYVNEQKEYTDLESILESEDLSNQVIAQALRELSYWKLKYTVYTKYFGGIFNAIEVAEREITSAKGQKTSKARSRKTRKGHRNTRHRKKAS